MDSSALTAKVNQGLALVFAKLAGFPESSFPLTAWHAPVAGVAVYLAVVLLLLPNPADRPKRAGVSKTLCFRSTVLLHNVILCVFSAVVFYGTFPLAYSAFKTRSFHDAMCAAPRDMRSAFEPYMWVFYVSKYYEFVDTLIIMYRGVRPSFLQVFHHSGAVFATWMLLVGHCPAAWVFVVFNSGIHTLMYFYYGLRVFYKQVSWKILMTTLQIVQFVVGVGLGVYYHEAPGCTPDGYPRFALQFNMVYTVSLFFLFSRFFVGTYLKKPKSRGDTCSAVDSCSDAHKAKAQ